MAFIAIGLLRIIEIEWAVKNDSVFKPSPKLRKKTRSKRKPKTVAHGSDAEDEGADVDEEVKQTRKNKGKHKRVGEMNEFGLEITNVDGLAKSKRPHSPAKQGAPEEEDGESVETPPKKRKTGSTRKLMVVESSEDEGSEYAPPVAAPPKKTRRKLLV